MVEYFVERLKLANVTSKYDISHFVKQTDFDDKLKNLNRKVLLNKTRSVEVKNKLEDLSKKVKLIPAKG